MTISRSSMEEAREQLEPLGLAFRLDGLNLPEATCAEIVKMAAGIVRHIKYVEPKPTGCALYIDEMAWPPDRDGWIRGYQKVQLPYWLPKLLVDDLRELQCALDDVAHFRATFDLAPVLAPFFRVGES